VIVSSLGSLQAMSPPTRTWPGGSAISLYDGNAQSYAHLYRTQPNVRKCVDFLARNIAQLGIHVFRRVSDTDRVRLATHPLANLLERPNPYVTRYRFFETLMQDLGIYLNAFWLRVRFNDTLTGLLRLPPDTVAVEGGLIPRRYLWTINGREQPFTPDQIVHFAGYDPFNPMGGLSPLETLRRVLAEEAAAYDYRRNFWLNAARMEGVIERPKDAPRWDEPLRARFREQWQSSMAGAANSGKTGILEDGMTWKQASFSARDSELSITRKLSGEEVAAAYHIPLPFVGILDHATFSNIREQHKHLYQDCLGPWCVMIAEELERQLLPDFEDAGRVYLEFNIAEKLKGSFEEQAAAIRDLCGGPVMTRAEGRARLNLPSLDDPDAEKLITPLNVSTSGEERPASNVLPFRPRGPGSPDNDDEDQVDAAAWALTVRAFWDRQGQRVQKDPVDERAFRFDIVRWNAELAAVLAPHFEAAGRSLDDATRLAARAAERINTETLALLLAEGAAFQPARPVGRVP